LGSHRVMTTVEIKTADTPVRVTVNDHTNASNDDGSYTSSTSLYETHLIPADSETTMTIYGNRNISIREVNDGDAFGLSEANPY